MENDNETFGFNVEVTPTGIVDGEGKFVPIDVVEQRKREHDTDGTAEEVHFVQIGEDAD